MKKYKVLKKFRDTEKKETYKVGQEIELEEDRAKEMTSKLKYYGGEFLEEIKEEDPKKEDTKKDKK